jgi:DNA-binding NtrC family response regulator
MQDAQGKILVIDDDQDVLTAANLLLKRHFAQVVTDAEPGNIPEHLAASAWDVILLDMNFEIGANTGKEGLYWLSLIRKQQPSALVILMTAYGAVDTAVNAMKDGAVDFVLKPWQNERLLTTIRNTLQLKESRDEVIHLRSRQKEIVSVPSDNLIGKSPAMQQVHSLVKRVAPTDANVLILGENGTGKEVVAREIYQQSKRRDEVFVSVDLGSVTESLFESELFGHKKGAFTGAATDRIGRFQAASGGTLFLDEIGNIPLHLQGKLLTVLEQRTVIPVGTNTPIPIDVRLLCATNKDLQQLVQSGQFREDLLYRINTVTIELPPLRKRQADIAGLLEHFLAVYAQKYNLPVPAVSAETINQLKQYPWPGNIRELRHAVERAMILGHSDKLQAGDLLMKSGSDSRPQSGTDLDDEYLNLEKLEQTAITTALQRHHGNISHAAKELGITRASLYRRLEKYGL